MLETGIKGEATEIVTEKNTAASVGSGELAVFATPAMIALMEQAAYRSVAARGRDKGEKQWIYWSAEINWM